MKRILLLAAASLSAGVGCTKAPASSSGDGLSLHPNAVAQIQTLLAEKNARSPARRKIASQLLYAANGMPGASSKTPLVPTGKPDEAGRVLVDLRAAVSPDLLAKIEKLGGKVLSNSVTPGSLRARVQLGSLDALAAEAAVTSIRPALEAATQRRDAPRAASAKFPKLTREQRIAQLKKTIGRSLLTLRPASATATPTAGDAVATNAGAANSEGGKAHGAERARKFFNVDGTGVKIGILSDSDDFKEESIASGDLPANTVTIPGQDGRPGSGEGTAMMQIVHDLAPGAQIFFATAFNSPESFADNIRRLRFEFGCDIIADDIIYFFESPYQDDIIAGAVDDVTDDGALYFSSAGNAGNYNDGTSGVWEGDFKNGGTLATLPDGYTVHSFGDGVISNRIEVGGGPLYLHWSDPGSLDNPMASNDYDLFLLDGDLRNVLVASTDIQNGDGTGLPFEFIGFNIPAGFRIVIGKHADAKTRAVRVVIGNGELGLSTPGNTYGHNSAAAAFGMAAVDVAEAAGGEFSGGPTTPVETYSSDGYRQIFYDRHGHKLGGGVTFASGGGETRRKPDLTAADGVSTTLPSFSGLNPFFGTSAAAPHAAAIAGLLKSASPRAEAEKLRRALVNGALDIEAKGYDRDSGAGIVSAFNSLVAIGARPSVFLELGTVTTTGSSGGFVLPGGTGRITAQLVNNGGAGAGVVRGTLSTTTPGVTITTASSSYPNIDPGSSGSNATPFAFSLASSADCGTKIDFRLSVTFSGRGQSPTVFHFSVQTGKPATTATTTSYAGAPVAIPDGDPAGVSVPLTVSGGTIADLRFHLDGDTCSAAAGATTVGLDHSWVGDLTLSLTSPAGTTVTLISRPGGELNSGNNFCKTVLSDSGATSIQSVTPAGAPYTGTFKPANALGAFNGESAAGTWVLTVSDSVDFDTGSVRKFGLDVTGFSCTP